MKVLVTGSSGLIGSALVRLLTNQGHQVIRLVRHKVADSKDVAVWDPDAGKLETSSLEQTDAVVHLAGESIAGGRWTEEQKKRIRESRVRGTRLLSESMAQLAAPPRTLVSASAMGFYGTREDEVLTEQSSPGSGFLAEVCQEWEAATDPAREKAIRVVNVRIGMVLSGEGGALASMVPIFRLGTGGKLGDGRQFVSWIALDDLTRAFAHAIGNESLSGPVNATSPNPVRNAELTRALGRVLGRPTFLSTPAFAVRMLFGEMADALLLSSVRMQPSRLLETGFSFEFPEIEGALRHVLKKA